MLYLDYISYFKTIAETLKDIRHSSADKRFTRINIEEVLTSTSTLNLNEICMTLESYETSVGDNLSDNLRDIKTGALMILKKARGNYDVQDQVLSDTEKTILKIVAKMKKDKRENINIKHLVLGSIKINKVGPLFDSAYGWRLTFEFDESLNHNVVYNPNDWDN